MTAREVIHFIDALPPKELDEVIEHVHEIEEIHDSAVPESFKRGMDQAKAGKFVDVEKVFSGERPPSRK